MPGLIVIFNIGFFRDSEKIGISAIPIDSVERREFFMANTFISMNTD